MTTAVKVLMNWSKGVTIQNLDYANELKEKDFKVCQKLNSCAEALKVVAYHQRFQMQSFRVFEFFSTLESSVFMPALPTHEWTGSDRHHLTLLGENVVIM
ncbi:hypothetical protein M513_01313 [Trichuris suis]|uniref:Uncharacterized protein n=1 Tax=Trichuris suis TaxID=68888 RepID=A0A085MK97_9BILA|nr:hypothetical protein M513_01313 [Trichuris suis]